MAAPEGSGRLITLDTSGLLALIDRRDRNHERVLAAYDADRGPHVVPAAVVGEIAYMLDQDLGIRVAASFFLDLASDLYELDCEEADLERGARIALRYESLSLGLVDGAVIACAARRGGRVLTLDRHHFDVVAREVDLEILP